MACGAQTVVTYSGKADADVSFDAGVPKNDAGIDSGMPQRSDAGSVDSGMMLADAGTDAGALTTFRVTYPAGTVQVFLRGSTAPLNWNTGMAMRQVDAVTWELAVSLSGDTEWKPLLGDSTWSKGPNYQAKQFGTVSVNSIVQQLRPN